MRAIPLFLLLTATACGTTAPANADAGTTLTDAGSITLDAGTRETKLVFAFEDSASLSVTDSDGQRATALASLLNQLPASTSILVTKSWGTNIAYLTPTQAAAFAPISSWNTSMRTSLQQDVLAHNTSSQGTRKVLPIHYQLQKDIAADIVRGGAASYHVI